MPTDAAQRLISMIDLTNLDDNCTIGDVQQLCRRAVETGVAGVCVWPDFVAFALEQIDQAMAAVDVVTVVNFPTGDERPLAVGAVCDRALRDGANEIDVVLPYRRFLAGDLDWCGLVLGRVREVTAGTALMKVILETGELGDDATIRRAADFAIECGADFIKSSTGKTSTSATPAAIQQMVDAIAAAGTAADGSTGQRPVGLKPSGGIKTFDDANEYVTIAERTLGSGWATPATFRFGASGLLDVLVDG